MSTKLSKKILYLLISKSSLKWFYMKNAIYILHEKLF